MTDTADTTHDTIDDPPAVVAALDELWHADPPQRYSDGQQLAACRRRRAWYALNAAAARLAVRRG